MTTETTPTNTPAPAAATPAAVVQSAPAVQATETPAQNTTIATDPFDPAAIQARIDAFLATKPAAPAAAAATETPAAAAAATPAAPAAGDTPAATTDTPAAAATTETTTDTPAAESQTPTPELVVDLPPRNANGAPLKIAAPDAATADALRRLNNGYMRGEEARTKLAEADAALTRVREVEIMLEADPLGLVERMPAPQRVNIARAMLAEHFEELRPVIESWWNDESERRLARAEGLESRDKARSSYQTQSSVAKQVRAVSDAVRTLIPDSVDASDATEFYQDAVRYLAGVAEGRDSGIVTPQEVPQLLQKRLQRYGFNNAANTTDTAPASTSTPAPAAAPAPSAQQAAAPAAAAPTVARVHAINQQRAAAAATTTVGAGATPVTALPKPPKGLTIEQAADWALAQRKAAAQ